tara:strand:+ start:1496 stop:2287 length:792 start_codon:yes stop_codon:yes gene_type:complete
MANITKTIIYPVPTVWKGQDQDDASIGIATYAGPAELTIHYDKIHVGTGGTFEEHTNIGRIVKGVWDSDDTQIRPPGVEEIEVKLNCDLYPLHACSLWGGIAQPDVLEITAGPSADPNPFIMDPHYLNEVYDMRSFYWDATKNSGSGGWSTPKFSNAVPNESEKDDDIANADDDTYLDWDTVRRVRNQMLESCDTKMSEDMPEAVKAPWKTYRQKLRDLPLDWAGVGTNTYLVQWPKDPQTQADFDAKLAAGELEHRGRPAGK